MELMQTKYVFSKTSKEQILRAVLQNYAKFIIMLQTTL